MTIFCKNWRLDPDPAKLILIREDGVPQYCFYLIALNNVAFLAGDPDQAEQPGVSSTHRHSRLTLSFKFFSLTC